MKINFIISPKGEFNEWTCLQCWMKGLIFPSQGIEHLCPVMQKEIK